MLQKTWKIIEKNGRMPRDQKILSDLKPGLYLTITSTYSKEISQKLYSYNFSFTAHELVLTNPGTFNLA